MKSNMLCGIGLLIIVYTFAFAVSDKPILKTIAIYNVNSLPSGVLTVLAWDRDGQGALCGTKVTKLRLNGEIEKTIDFGELGKEWWFNPAFDEDGNLWISNKDKLYKIEAANCLTGRIKPIFQIDLPKYSGDLIILKDKMIIYPNMISTDKGKNWTKLFNDVDFYPKEANANYSMYTLDHYAYEWPSGNIYKATLCIKDKKLESIKLEEYDCCTKKWKLENEISLKSESIPSFNMDFTFIVSEKYYIMSEDCGADAGRVILVFNRTNKELKCFKKAVEDCSDYDLTGIIPKVIVDDILLARCPRGGYINFDLKEGKISSREFSKYHCELFNPPENTYLLMTYGTKLFVSMDKGKNWKEIFDVRNLENLQEQRNPPKNE